MPALVTFEITSVTVSGGQRSSSPWCTPRNTGYQSGANESPSGSSAEMDLDELRAETAFWNHLSAETLLKFEESLE